MTRPIILDFLPESLKTRVLPVSGIKPTLAGMMLRAVVETHKSLTLPFERAKKLAHDLDAQCDTVMNAKGAVFWFSDTSVVLASTRQNGVELYPLTLIRGMHSSHTLVAQLLPTKWTWPSPILTMADVLDTTRPLTTWMPLNGGWEKASLPDWAKDRKRLEKHLSNLFTFALIRDDLRYTRFHFTMEGRSVNDAGFIVGGEPKGTIQSGPWRQRILHSLTITMNLIDEATHPDWFIETWVSAQKIHNGSYKVSQIHPGTLFSVQSNTSFSPTSSHDTMEFLTCLPQSIVASALE